MTRVEDYILPSGKLKSEVLAKAKARAEKKRTKGLTKKRVTAQQKRRRETRVGKLGIVRLRGEDLAELRRDCFIRDGYTCQECKRPVAWGEGEYLWGIHLLPVGEMAHIRTKRNNGDTLDNVRTLCPDCHRKEHAYGKSMQKPCPKKERY